MNHRRRQSQLTMASFFFSDWRFLAQMGLLFVALALGSSVRDVLRLRSPGDGIQALPLLDLIEISVGTNLAAAAALFLPFVLFVWAGHWLRPSGSLVLKRGLAFVAFGLYFFLAKVPVGGPTFQAFYWASDPKFRSGDVAAAASVALVLGAMLVVCYRFISESRGFVTAVSRLVFLAALAVVFLSVQGGRPSFLRLEVPQDFRLRIVLILEGLEFSQANAYLSQLPDSALLNNVRSFRPLVTPTQSFDGQLATLLSGQEPYRHGIRSDEALQEKGSFFVRDLSQQLQELSVRSQLHLSSITNPSGFARMIMGAEAHRDSRSAARPWVAEGVLCPRPLANEFARDLEELKLVRDHLEPFLPRSVLQRVFPQSRCLPFGSPVEDLIHEESVDQLMVAVRQALESTASASGASPNVLSVWNFKLDALHPPTAENPDPRQQNFGLLLFEFLKTLDIMNLTPHAEIHIIGLVRSVNSFGTYIAMTPGTVRSTPWPLSDENMLTDLRDLSPLFGATPGSQAASWDALAGDQSEFVRKRQLREGVFYREHQSEGSSTGLGAREYAIKLQREGLCVTRSAVTQGDVTGPVEMGSTPEASPLRSTVSALNSPSLPNAANASNYVNVGFIAGVAAPLQLSAPMLSEMTAPVVLSDPERCRKEILRLISSSVVQDIDLFEPYGGASVDLELATKNPKEPLP